MGNQNSTSIADALLSVAGTLNQNGRNCQAGQMDNETIRNQLFIKRFYCCYISLSQPPDNESSQSAALFASWGFRQTVLHLPPESSHTSTPCSTQRFSIFDASRVSTAAILHKAPLDTLRVQLNKRLNKMKRNSMYFNDL